jgi:hypothetical protein
VVRRVGHKLGTDAEGLVDGAVQSLLQAVDYMTRYRQELCQLLAETPGEPDMNPPEVLLHRFWHGLGDETEACAARAHWEQSRVSPRDYLDIGTMPLLDLLSQVVVVVEGCENVEELFQDLSVLWTEVVGGWQDAPAQWYLPEELKLLQLKMGACPVSGCSGHLLEERVQERSADESTSVYRVCSRYPRCSWRKRVG